MKFELTQQLVKKIFEYDPLTGVVVWRKATSKQTTIGELAGCDNHKGYLRVGIYGKSYLLHIVIWVYMTGKMPERDIGHIDGDKLNNAWANLREGKYNRMQHLANRLSKKLFSTNKSGYTGVFLRKQKGRKTKMASDHNVESKTYISRKL